jgi:leucyl aminopeptidase
VGLKEGKLQEIDQLSEGALSDVVRRYDFKGSKGSMQSVWFGREIKYLAVVGLGKLQEATGGSQSDFSVWRSFGKSIASLKKSLKASKIGISLSQQISESSDLNLIAMNIASGIMTGGYESTRFKSKGPKQIVGGIEILFLTEKNLPSIEKGLALGKGALFSRWLVESPPNVCTPSYLADAAAHIASIAPEHMSLQILEKEDCEKLGMGLYLGVAEASLEPPKFIHLIYKPMNEATRKVAIIGKGLTFDSGGYNLKAGAGSMIDMMKFDMGGAGAALGAARVIADLKPPEVEIHFIIASCENMIDGKGLRPGDILVASNGKTVEVNNTDAEGRLTLADALLYAQEQCQVNYIVDIATLTGACMIALGGEIGGMYASSEDVAHQLQEASTSTGEKIWRMPLEQAYLEQLKSPIADLKNTGGRMGGSITAALFLKEFVDLDRVKWSHLDIAGPVWNEKEGGATGFGAQLLAEWAINHSK